MRQGAGGETVILLNLWVRHDPRVARRGCRRAIDSTQNGGGARFEVLTLSLDPLAHTERGRAQNNGTGSHLLPDKLLMTAEVSRSAVRRSTDRM